MKSIYSVLFILPATEVASAEKIECGYIFSSVKNVKIESCDKDKIEMIGISHRRKLRLEGSIIISESSAHTNYDLKINNNYIEPSNTGRYTTHIDIKYSLPTKYGTLQAIHSDKTFGDGQLNKNNIYYACPQPEFKKCLMLEVDGLVKKSDVDKILAKMAEAQW